MLHVPSMEGLGVIGRGATPGISLRFPAPTFPVPLLQWQVALSPLLWPTTHTPESQVPSDDLMPGRPDWEDARATRSRAPSDLREFRLGFWLGRFPPTQGTERRTRRLLMVPWREPQLRKERQRMMPNRRRLDVPERSTG